MQSITFHIYFDLPALFPGPCLFSISMNKRSSCWHEVQHSSPLISLPPMIRGSLLILKRKKVAHVVTSLSFLPACPIDATVPRKTLSPPLKPSEDSERDLPMCDILTCAAPEEVSELTEVTLTSLPSSAHFSVISDPPCTQRSFLRSPLNWGRKLPLTPLTGNLIK